MPTSGVVTEGSAPEGDAAAAVPGGRGRAKLVLLSTGIIVVLAAAIVVATLLASTRPAASTQAAPRPAKPVPAVPLRVLSVTQGGQTSGTDGADPIQVTLSTPLSAHSPLPTVTPAVPGAWARTGSTLTFTPDTPFQPGTTVRVRFASGPAGLRSASGGLLGAPAAAQVQTAGWSTLRLQQLLAQLGYLPLRWTPATGVAAGGTISANTMAAQLANVYSPPAGTFTWEAGYPRILTTFWAEGTGSLILDGAIRAFQSNLGLTMTGVVTPSLYQDVMQAALAGHANPNGYTYALASKSSPETLEVWHDGQVVLDTLANTGIPVAPTADGTYPVYLRYSFQIMKGTNPDGTKYADPVSWVAYFNGGDAVHYFPRYSYGFPQSLGCVELPYAQAKQVWPYLTYGSLVTVAG